MMAAEQHVENEENPNLKRKREPSVLDNFTRLTNGVDKVRIKAGVELLKHLSENKNEEKGEDELKYALGRLVRGLGASKVQARTGFFTALVGLFNIEEVSVGDVLEHVTKELHKGGSNSKSENADVCGGQILVAGAIIRSNLYQTLNDEDKTKVLQLLLTAGKQRTYLNLASYKFLTDLFEKIDSKEFERVVFALIKNDLSKPWPEQNLDSLYLLLEIQDTFPESLHKKFLKNNLGTSEILCEESLQQLCNTLTVIPRLLALKHPIFDLMIKKISETNFMEQFFDQLDATLTRPNRNKYFVFTKLLTGILERITDPTIIPNILTNNFIQQTISTYKTAVGKQKDKQFKDVTQKFFETLLTALRKDNVKTKTKIRVLKKLLFNPGTFIFEKVTKSKLVQNITGALNGDGVKKLGAIYRDVVLGTYDKGGDSWWNADRIYAGHLLVKLVNHPGVQEEEDWKVEQLLFLGKLGLLQNEGVGYDLAEAFKETFYSSLDLKLSKLENLRSILSKIVHHFDEIVGSDVLRSPLEEKDLETWKKTVQLATKLEGRSEKKYAVFHTLFLNLGLQIFNNSKLGTDSLTELFSCYERMKKKKKESSDDPLWIEVVVDLFLNLLSHNSHLLRSVINCVFPHLCTYMNGTAIYQILAVLDPKNETNPLTQPEEDSDDDEEDNEDEEESSDEAEDEDEEENVSDKLRMALHQILGADVASDAESVDLDTLDDEEGAKLDEALGQTFKQFKPNLGKNKKQKKDDEALTHFRIRVLDLVEIYLNSTPSMLLTLEIMLPLLQLLEFCIKNEHQKPLQDRVCSVLKKLTSVKKFSETDDVTETVLVDLLKSLLEKGTRNAVVIQEMGEKISEGAIFVITCAQILAQTGKVSDVVKDSLEVFFTRRDCIIPYVFFKSLMQMNWDGIIPLVPFLTGFVFATSVRPFRRNHAIELLVIFCHNQRFISAHLQEIKTVDDSLVNFLKDCVDFFREFNSDPGQKRVKERFLTNLFELMQSIKTSVLAKGFDNWDNLGSVVRECRSQLTLSRDTKRAFNKFCKSLNISNVVQMKEKTVKLNNVDENDDGEPAKKKKKQNECNGVQKKKNKESLKLKKQSKELRLQSLSGGFATKRKFNWEEEDVDT